MKLSYTEDPEGVIAREESRRKKELGIFEISEPHELLFSQVSKEVFTQVVPGLVVDFRPPLFCVSWSDGKEQLLVKKELDFFRRIHDKQNGLANKRREAREEKILKAAKMNGTLSTILKGKDIGDFEDIDSICDRSVLEWRLLELIANSTNNSDNSTVRTMPLDAQDETSSSSTTVITSKSTVKAGGKQKKEEKGIIHVRNCTHLAKGKEPPVSLWLQSRAVVQELHLVHCSISGSPPAGLMALSGLEVLDLSNNQLVSPDPPPLPEESTPEWAREGSLKELNTLILRSNLLGSSLLSKSAGMLGSESLTWCKHLKYLDISDNPHLIALPASVSLMVKLEVLKAEHCSLNRVAGGLWACTSLTQLHLSHNKLKSLEDVDTYGIRVAPKLEKMKNLIMLDIGFNEMTVVPEEVWSLASLSQFYVRGNPHLQTPPLEFQLVDNRSTASSKKTSRSQSKRSERSSNHSLESEVMSKDERMLSEKARIALTAESLGYVLDEWIPSPFSLLNMSGCGLSGLPYALVAGASTAFTSSINFERTRMKEIMAETDSSSDEEETTKKASRPKSRQKSSSSVASTESESTINTSESTVTTAATTTTPIKQKKKMNARQLLKIEKKAAKKERRTRVAPLVGIENTTDLNLSGNNLGYFPCMVDSIKGSVLIEEASLMCCRFKSLTNLNLSKNQLKSINEDLFIHSTALTSIDLSFNQLQNIPASLCESTTRLTCLMLDHNRISQLPTSIGSLALLTKLTASFNLLTNLPDSMSCLSSLHTIDLASNFDLQPPQLMEAVQTGRRAVIRNLLHLPDSFSLSNKAEKFCPKQSLTVRRLAGGVIAEDEAQIRSEDQSDSESEEEEKPAKIMKPPSSEILVYDHQGDILDYTTKESYLCKTYSLYYQVERVLPPKHVRKEDPDADTLSTV